MSETTRPAPTDRVLAAVAAAYQRRWCEEMVRHLDADRRRDAFDIDKHRRSL